MRVIWVVTLLVAALTSAQASVARPKPVKAKAGAVAKGVHRPASRSEAQQKKKKGGPATKTTVRRVVVRRMVHGRWVQVSRVVRVRTGPVVPPHPDAERLREIQQALADKGYFKGEVNGTWNADSVDALKRFQEAKNINADGKINALSLIGLGLGPKHDSSVAAAPAAPPQQNIPQ